MGAATAIVVSLASLYITMRQTHVAEKQLEASVWPSLIYDTENGGDDGKPLITFGLKNGGVGPARVRSLEVSFHGKTVKDHVELLTEIAGGHGYTIGGVGVVTVLGRLLTPGQELVFLQVPPRSDDDPFFKHLDEVRFDVDGRVCFCSVLEQCWTLGFHEREPTPIKDCVEASKRVQYGR
jgi:hypothetical protein